MDKINKCGCGGECIIKRRVETNKLLSRIICKDCGFSSGEYFSIETAIERWNTAHPEISNAEKTYNWIRCGKNITHCEQSDFYYLWCQEKGLVLERIKNEKYEKGEGTPVCGSLLFERHWKLYEEPKKTEKQETPCLHDIIDDISKVVKQLEQWKKKNEVMSVAKVHE